MEVFQKILIEDKLTHRHFGIVASKISSNYIKKNACFLQEKNSLFFHISRVSFHETLMQN